TDIWQLFDIEKTDKKSKAVCKFCCFKCAFPNATRMTNHILNQCSKCSLKIKQKYGNGIQSSSKSSMSEEKESNKDILLEALQDTSLPSTSKKDTSSMSSSSESPLPSVKLKKASCQQTLNGFFDKIAISGSSKIDEALARALYASGAPFTLFKNKYWEQYIEDTILDILQQVDLTSSLIESLLKYVEERYEFCSKPIHFAANLLDARFKGEQLNEDQLMEAIDLISEMARSLNLDVGKVVANLAQFRTKTGFFSRNPLWDSANGTHPVIWWQGLCTSQPLMPIASRILNRPPSSASSERNWSLHGLIHTGKRNRLSQDKIQKLVSIHSNLVINGKQTFIYDARPVPLLEDTGKDYAVLSVHEDEAEIESE
ncbi:unnamed protein product, partial [Acanthoscelides obtectus]